jgi:hypothetical protein
MAEENCVTCRKKVVCKWWSIVDICLVDMISAIFKTDDPSVKDEDDARKDLSRVAGRFCVCDNYETT